MFRFIATAAMVLGGVLATHPAQAFHHHRRSAGCAYGGCAYGGGGSGCGGYGGYGGATYGGGYSGYGNAWGGYRAYGASNLPLYYQANGALTPTFSYAANGLSGGPLMANPSGSLSGYFTTRDTRGVAAGYPPLAIYIAPYYPAASQVAKTIATTPGATPVAHKRTQLIATGQQ